MTTETLPAGTPALDATGAGGAPAAGEQTSGIPAGEPAAPVLGADGKPVEVKADDKGKPGDTPEVPEKYELKMPEGVELDTAAAEEFSALAKELKLSPADAQRVADVAVKMQQKQAEKFAETVKGWVDQCKTDKEFGGDAFEANRTVARKTIDTFGDSELKTLLNSSGIGNHPAVARFVLKIGKAISEDTFLKAGSRVPTGGGDDLAKRMYPDMN